MDKYATPLNQFLMKFKKTYGAPPDVLFLENIGAAIMRERIGNGGHGCANMSSTT